MNPIQIIKNFMNKGGNPQDLLTQAISKSGGNPMISKLMQMAKSGDTQGVEVFARNLFKERGRDFDKEFENFMQQLKR
jgi:hypothetical protein